MKVVVDWGSKRAAMKRGEKEIPTFRGQEADD